MSMNLIRFENQTVTPKHDSIQWDDGRCGKLNGCEITHIGANVLRITSGYLIILGRLIEVSQMDVNVNVSDAGEKNGQIFLRMDLASDNPLEIITEAASSLTPLTQNEKANYENGIYEMLLATYRISETTISSLEVKVQELEPLGKEVNDLNTNLNGFEFQVVDGKPQWRNVKAGADTFAPFKSSNFTATTLLNVSNSNNRDGKTYTFTDDYDLIIFQNENETVDNTRVTFTYNGSGRIISEIYNIATFNDQSFRSVNDIKIIMNVKKGESITFKLVNYYANTAGYSIIGIKSA